MNNDQFEAQMRTGECFHALRMLSGAWSVIRVDGHGFSRLTTAHFEKPFDERFHAAMVLATKALLEEFQGIYAYTESDEISILLPQSWEMFNRSLEKAVSLSAGIASAAFTQASGQIAHFDSRIWLSDSMEAVADYFRWRQTDATRCALNGWCYWTLRKAGQDVHQATTTLKRQTVEYKKKLLSGHGIAFEELPAWQRRGVGLWWENYEKEGFDPVRKQTVPATRRRIRIESNLPAGEDYADLLHRIATPEIET